MWILYFDGPTVPVRLADRMQVTRGNISMLMGRMQEEGLIEPSEEFGTKSRPAMELTAKGRSQFESILPKHVDVLEEVFTPLGEPTHKKLKKIRDRATGP